MQKWLNSKELGKNYFMVVLDFKFPHTYIIYIAIQIYGRPTHKAAALSIRKKNTFKSINRFKLARFM